jgi:titin
MPRTNKILIRSGTTTPSASDFAVGEPAFDKSAGKLYIKNAAGTMVELGTGGGGGGSVDVYAYATPASFPATGSSAVIYIATDTSRAYQWADTAYMELGPIGGNVDTVLRSLLVPPAPTSLTVAAGDAQATLSWTAPTVLAQTPITDYTEQYSADNGANWTTFTQAASTATSATVTGLTNGTAYKFRVAAVNAVGVGAYTSASSAVTPVAVVPDPFFSNVQLLLHADGVGDTFVDSSPAPKNITAVGAATQSSAQSKWGGKSLALNGSNANLSLPSASFSFTGDFVIEAWVYLNSISTYATIAETRSSPSYANFICGVYDVGGGLRRLDFVTVGGAGARLTGSSTTVPLNAWAHIAFVRSGGVLSVYVNGTRDSTQLNYSSTITPQSATMLIGRNVDGSFVDGYIDDLRITVDSNRGYTGATITVPTAAFPDL